MWCHPLFVYLCAQICLTTHCSLSRRLSTVSTPRHCEIDMHKLPQSLMGWWFHKWCLIWDGLMLNCILCFQHVIGSILSGPGSGPGPQASPTVWMDMVDGFQKAALSTRLGIPLMYGIDAVHGHNNVYGATIFPHNVGLGSTRWVFVYVCSFLCVSDCICACAWECVS